MSFYTHGYEVVKNAISEDVVRLCVEELSLYRQKTYVLNNVEDNEENKLFFCDAFISKCFSVYGLLCLEALSNILLPKLSKITKKRLVPTYSICRIYYNKATMQRHIDRESCEYSASFCLKIDEKVGTWPLWFEDLSKIETSVFLQPGDIVVYKGQELNHWRNEYKGNEHIQAFLHYVDSEGKYKDFIYDKRKVQGLNSAEKRYLNLKNKEEDICEYK